MIKNIKQWKPNRLSTIPIYKQIITYVKEKIASGEWYVGMKLPTQREMAANFDVNRSTLIEAIDELKADGLIEGNGRGGTTIVNNTWSILASNMSPNWEDYIKYGIYKPNIHTIQMINKFEFEDGIIRLGTGEPSPELFPHEMMKSVLNKVSDKMCSLGYEEPKGSLYLRKVISEYVKRFGIKASPNSILIVSGSLQALQLISMSILQPGSTVLVERPSYLKSLHIFQSSGIRLKGIAMDNYGIKVEKLRSVISKNTAFLYTIPTYHNPTGIVMPANRRKELINLCSENRLPIIEDDAYRELWIDEEPPMALKSMDKNGDVLYIGTMSKVFAPGIRIGWIIGPEPVIERLGDIKMQTDYGSSSISQLIAAEWISSGLYDKYLKELRYNLKVRREAALDMLEKNFYDIASWNKPKGGFYIWLRIMNNTSIEKLFSMAYKEGILINPGSIYDFEKNEYIRISYSYASISDLKYGLKKLSDIIKR